MKETFIDIEQSTDGGRTWEPTRTTTTSMIGHALTKGGRDVVHQIHASYRLLKVRQ